MLYHLFCLNIKLFLFSFRFAFARFENEELAKAAHEKAQVKQIRGDTLVVLFARKRVEKVEAQKRKKENKRKCT